MEENEEKPIAMLLQRDEGILTSLLSGSLPSCYVLYVTNEFVIQPVVKIEGRYQLDKGSNLVFSDSKNRLRGINEGIRRGIITIVRPIDITREEVTRLRDAGKAYEAKNEEIRGAVSNLLKKSESAKP